MRDEKWGKRKERWGMRRNHKNLKVWEKAVDLAENIYTITKKFPKEELYGIVSQIRRAAVSISANIAEGAARNSNKEYI